MKNSQLQHLSHELGPQNIKVTATAGSLAAHGRYRISYESNAILVWLSMVEANVLVLSRSSFGIHVCASLISRGVVTAW